MLLAEQIYGLHLLIGFSWYPILGVKEGFSRKIRIQHVAFNEDRQDSNSK